MSKSRYLSLVMFALATYGAGVANAGPAHLQGPAIVTAAGPGPVPEQLTAGPGPMS
jgi:hypothetical protein